MRWFVVALAVVTFGLVCGVIGYLIGDARGSTKVQITQCPSDTLDWGDRSTGC